MEGQRCAVRAPRKETGGGMKIELSGAWLMFSVLLAVAQHQEWINIGWAAVVGIAFLPL